MRSICAVVGFSYFVALSVASHLRSDLPHSFQELTRWKANETYAVLVAGSNTYENYRHQADVCHAYQLLSSHGVPDENIVLMMFDDVAFDSENPRQGEMINRPGGEDVYARVPKDYTGEQVTAAHFLKVLRGESVGVGSGKTLRSGPRAHVFVYYADHGASGLVSMPTGEYLYANDLMRTLQDMHDKHRYKQLVFYLEACESGSMFADLNPGLNIYATTASNPFESSYACYYDEELGTYLGDCYSVSWMEDSDVSDLTHETLDLQYQRVKNMTTESSVMQYGQLQIDTEPVASFQAGFDEQAKRRRRVPYPPVDRSPLDARDVRLFYLRQKVAKAQTLEEVKRYTRQLNAEIDSREQADRVFAAFAEQISGAQPQGSDVDEDCLRSVVEGTEGACGKFTTYSLKYVRYLNDACQRGVASELTLDIINAICNNATVSIEEMFRGSEGHLNVKSAFT